MPRKRSSMVYYAMLGPVIVAVAVLFGYPLAKVFQLSFLQYTPGLPIEFIGLRNYVDSFTDPIFLATIRRTFIYTGGVVLANFWIGIGLALLTYEKFKGVKLLRTIIILPMVFIPSAASIVWVLMYNEKIGIINHLLSAIGLESYAFLSDPTSALIGVMITDIWAWTPFMYLILLAGLQNLPSELVEAARIDGASSTKIFWSITLPFMQPVIAVAVLIKLLDTFRTFPYLWIMTRGGPGDTTHVLSTLAFKKAFVTFEFGLSSTYGVITLLLAMAIGIPLTYILIWRRVR